MLSPLSLSKRTIFRWVNLKSAISSISCIQMSPEIDQTVSNATDFEANIQFLRNELYPDSLIKVLQNTTDVNSAIKIFKWASLQKHFNHTSETYYWIILKLGLAGNTLELEGFCQNLVKEKCSGVEHVLVSLVESFVRHRRVCEASCVLVSMSLGGYKPEISLFNVVLRGVVEEKKGFKEFVFVYKEMVKAGLTPSIDTLNCLIEVLFDSKMVDSALDQYRRLSKKLCSPNSRTFEIVIKGLVLNDRVDDSVVVLHEMMRIGCLPELSFYTCVIPLFCGENKLDEASRLFRMMQTSEVVPNPVVYGALIRCLCKNHRLDDVVNVLEEIGESCSTLDNDVLVDVVNEFCRLGKIDEAMKFLDNENILETSPYNALLEGCCNAGKFIMAKEVLVKMLKKSLAECDSWNILIRWLCDKAKIKKASEFVGRMIITSSIPNRDTYSALITGHCRSNESEDALRLFVQLRTKCWVLDSVSYSELIEGLCGAGKHLEAMAVFHYMFGNGCSLQFLSFSILIKTICEKGMVNEAVRLQQMVRNSGMCCGNDTYKYIMLGLSNSDERRSVLVYLSRVLVIGCNLDAEAYCILIRSMIAQNRGNDCSVFLADMVHKGLIPDSETLHSLLSHLTNRSQLYLISATIGELAVNSQVIDSVMYNILINGFWKERLKTEACRLLDLMLEKGWVPDATTHRLLVGSVDSRESNEKMLTYENLTIKDSVTDILADALGET
ncbi:pentatricopeptide repeat-containing protein At1g62914, mitochondrial-like [Mercurialis annua]|uniref:pentatricopeptide repeat-containing protein At1g62914, mitochondrial-like n=1 Tax=Mercurialis annua TaxID=3986 RepID=UPI00215E0622|nr:pentatricopeptide repeat-containing protein At1g62914, mitochondrial-like [Mercurialis annua]